jgi:SAM-dependent methyltransferase
MEDRIRDTAAYYEGHADSYRERNADRSVIEDVVTAFFEALGGDGSDPAFDGERVLDVGCGPGWETARFARAGLHPVGLDLTQAFVAETRERADSPVARGDARRLPFAEHSFSGVWACASLLHLPREDFPTALDEISRVLRPGGAFTLSMQLPLSRWDEVPERETAEADRHFERYKPDTLRELLADAGFREIALSTGDRWVAGTTVVPDR